MSLSTALHGEIVVVTGPPGAGKSTITDRLVSHLDRGTLLDGDAFFHSIRSGWIPPWKPASREQNVVVMQALAAAAGRFADGGYGVIVDGIIGPWMLPTFLAEAAAPIHYAVLRPSAEVAMHRATSRDDPALVDPEPIAKMYGSFANLGPHEHHVVDTTDDEIAATVTRLVELLAAGDLRLG